MKNIHIIPTDKPSRLAKHSSGSFHIVSYIAHKKGLYKMTNQHIYITNDEEIKEGDWVIECSLNWVFKMHKHGLPNYNPNKKKIILTTDPDLIKDGVQSIDDTFLEWFVKNTSCVFVEVQEKSNNEILIELGGYKHDEGLLESDYQQWLKDGGQLYKIIIPQEELKQEVTGVDDNRPKPNYCYAKEQGHGEIGCVFPACHCGLPIKQEEPKQETIEEFINQSNTPEGLDQFSYDKGLEDGAKWQKERMYSEEEVYNLLEEAMKDCYTFELEYHHSGDYKNLKEWFEQYKKKFG